MKTLISVVFRFFFAFLPLHRRQLRRLTLRSQHELSAGAINADNIYAFHGEQFTKHHCADNFTQGRIFDTDASLQIFGLFVFGQAKYFFIYTMEFQG